MEVSSIDRASIHSPDPSVERSPCAAGKWVVGAIWVTPDHEIPALVERVA